MRVEEVQFNNVETQIVVNAKLVLDINKSIEAIKINLKYLEQDIKNKLLEKKKILLEAANLDKEQQTILRNHLERNILQSQRSCILELEKCKIKQSKILFN